MLKNFPQCQKNVTLGLRLELWCKLIHSNGFRSRSFFTLTESVPLGQHCRVKLNTSHEIHYSHYLSAFIQSFRIAHSSLFSKQTHWTPTGWQWVDSGLLDDWRGNMLSLSHTQVYFMNLDLPSSVVLDREKCVNSTCSFTVYTEENQSSYYSCNKQRLFTFHHPMWFYNMQFRCMKSFSKENGNFCKPAPQKGFIIISGAKANIIITIACI